jgi:hypothetical protein
MLGGDMFGFLSSPFRYDPLFEAGQQSPAQSWRMEGKVMVFGPKYASAVLAQEQAFLNAGDTQERAESAEWVRGLSAKMLREQFPEAVRDVEQQKHEHRLPPMR